MRSAGIVGCALYVAVVSFGAEAISGDAKRGAEVFQSQHCVACHSLNGQGGTVASDLGRKQGLDTTPFLMANLMWNHAPDMWAEMERSGVQKPLLSPQDAADLFTFFWAARYFEPPGDVTRGRELFASKRCSGCHDPSVPIPGGGPPLAQWPTLGSPVALASQMWGHSAQMRAAMAKKKVPFPQLAGQDMTDILTYVRSATPQTSALDELFLSSSTSGSALFQAKGCAGCHKGSESLERGFGHRTMADFAAAMWDHAPQMRQPPPSLTSSEMQQIVDYLWSTQYFTQRGDAKAGKKVFEAKHCAECHNDPSSGAPKLAGTERTAYSMVAVLWQHGPTMLARMRARKIPWPRFQKSEMADLAAYLTELK